MNNNKQKEIYEANPSDWVVYFYIKVKNKWAKLSSNMQPYMKDTHKLIAKKHEHIADAVIANPDVEVEWLNGLNLDKEKVFQCLECGSNDIACEMGSNKGYCEDCDSSEYAEVDKFYCSCTNFFISYVDHQTYRLKETKPKSIGDIAVEYVEQRDKATISKMETKPVNFNGGYIVASQEAYDLLIKLKYTMFDSFELTDMFLLVSNNTVYNYRFDARKGYKQFYINNEELSWNEPIEDCDPRLDYLFDKSTLVNSIATAFNELPIVEEGEEDGKRYNSNDMLDDNSSSVYMEGTLSITDDNGKVYEFEKPEFECELLKVVGLWIVGYSKMDEGNLTLMARCWDKNTGIMIDSDTIRYFDLTPIKKQWYEEFIDAEPFEIAVVDKGNCIFTATGFDGTMFYDSNGNEISFATNLRLATKDEVMSLYWEGKEK